MDLLFEMMVVGSDGQGAGWLDRVLVDPARREVSHVVVRTQRASEEVILTLDQVTGSSGERLLVKVPADGLAGLPRYYEGRTTSPPAGRIDTSLVREPPRARSDLESALGVSPGAIELGPEDRVTVTNGPDYQLLGLATEDPTGRISGVLVGFPGEWIVTVPAVWIGELRPDGVTLSTTAEDVGRLPGAPAGPYLAEK